jgi:tetratricopeptide (TPR) repeat protein
MAYLSLEEPDRAVPPLRELARRRPGPESTLLLVRALRLAGEAAEAKALLDHAITQSPSDPALHVERALLARSLDDNVGAVRAWTRVTELQPRDATAQFNLAESLQRSARTDEAIATYRKALELDPNLTVAKVNLAKALAEKGLTGEAKELLMAAAQAAPLDPATHYNLGVLLLREGNIPGAIGAFERTLQLDPRSAQAHTQPRRGAGLEGGLPGRAPRVPRRDPRGPALGRGVVQPGPLLLPHRRQPAREPGLRPRAGPSIPAPAPLHAAGTALPEAGQADPGRGRLPEGHCPDGRGPQGLAEHRGLPGAGHRLRGARQVQGGHRGPGKGGARVPAGRERPRRARRRAPGDGRPRRRHRRGGEAAAARGHRRGAPGAGRALRPQAGQREGRAAVPGGAEGEAGGPGCRPRACRSVPGQGRLRRRRASAGPGKGPPSRRHRAALAPGSPAQPPRPSGPGAPRAGAADPPRPPPSSRRRPSSARSTSAAAIRTRR